METLDIIIVVVLGAVALGMIIRHGVIRYKVKKAKKINSDEYIRNMYSK